MGRDDPPDSERGQRISRPASTSDIDELFDEKLHGTERRLARFLDKREQKEVIRARLDSEFRENIAKMGSQISELFNRDAVDVLGLHGVKETLMQFAQKHVEYDRLLKALTDAETKRAGAMRMLQIMAAVGMVVVPVIWAGVWWVLSHVPVH